MRVEPPKRRIVRIAAVVLPPLVLVAVFVGFWYFVSRVWMSERRRFLVPPPHEVVRRGFLEWDNLHEMLDALWSSVRVAGIGLAISVVLGVALATLMSQSKLIERATFPLMVALQAMPILALVPMIAIMVRLQPDVAGDRVRADHDLPDRAEHAVRPGVGRSRPARPDHAAPRRAGHATAQGDVPVGPAGDVRRAAHLGRAVGHRRDRRRLLLRQGREGPRSADPAVRQQLQRHPRDVRHHARGGDARASSCSCCSALLQHAVIGAWYDSKSGGGR